MFCTAGGGLGGAPLEHQKQRASIIHISTGSEPLIWPDALSGSDERRDLLRLTALLNHDVPLHRSKARHPEHPSWQENYLGCSSKSSRDPLNYSEDALVLFTHLTLHLDDRRQRWQCSLSRVISGPRYLPIRKICILAFIDPIACALKLAADAAPCAPRKPTPEHKGGSWDRAGSQYYKTALTSTRRSAVA